MKISERKELPCQLCGGTEAVRQIDWETDGLLALPLCGLCRAQLLAALATDAAEERGRARPKVSAAVKLSPAAEAVRREAASMTEAAFEEKYLPHPIDRVLFAYIRGYGQVDMDGEGNGMVVLIMDGTASEQEVVDHLAALADRGVVYPVPGKAGWYGVDYVFRDD